ncbi:MAG: DUF4386 domain-containing protein [Microlunatus sp.]
MNTVSLRTASLLAGGSLAVMAALGPLALMVALPTGAVGVAALMVVVVATLDIVTAVALFPVLAGGGTLIAGCSAALRLGYGAIFATAAGFLVAPADVVRFQAIWDLGLFVFGAHLLLTGVAVLRGSRMPSWIGALVAIAGLGYLVDAVSVALVPAKPLALGQFTFVGEVVLLIWLLGWGGRERRHPVTVVSQVSLGRDVRPL